MRNLSRSQKQNGSLWTQKKKGGIKESSGVCPGQQVSMYEVWKEQQVHEDARKVYGAEVFVI